jgi:hypothetical protein
MDKRSRGVVVTCIAILIFVSLVHTMQWRDVRFFESFDTAHTMNAIRDPKNDAYFAAGMKYFFTDGTGDAKQMFFVPSDNDVVCNLTSAEVMSSCDPTRRRIDAVSRPDETTLFKSAYTCKNVMASATNSPIDGDSCNVRIYNGMYEFVKSCIVLSAYTMASGQLALDPSDYGTKAFVLSRALFLVAPGSMLYGVDYSHAIRYDSASTTPFTIGLAPALATISDPSRTLTIQQSLATFASSASTMPQQQKKVTMPATLYYMNFLQHIAGVPESQVKSDGVRCLTCIVPSALFATLHYSYRGVITITGTGTAVTVSVGGSSVINSIPTMTNGMVIVVYTGALLVMCSLSRGRVMLNTIKGNPQLNAVAAMLADIRASYPKPSDTSLYPYATNVNGVLSYTFNCIPNLADIAIKAGLLI